YANPLVLGYAWQKGWIPLQKSSLQEAIRLNGVMVEKNLDAFEWGRRAAHEGAGTLLERHSPSAAAGKVLAMPPTLDQVIEQNEKWLAGYQNLAYARRYREKVMAIKQKESSLPPTANARVSSDRLT